MAVLDGHEVRFNLEEEAVDTDKHRRKASKAECIDGYDRTKMGLLTLETHTLTHKYRVSSGSPGVVSFVAFITQLVFPFLHCLGHSRLPVIKNNAVVPRRMAGNNKERHSYTHGCPL